MSALAASTFRRGAGAGPLSHHRTSVATVAAVLAVTVFTLVLRLSQIHQSLFGDELFTYADVHGRSFSAVLRTVHTGGENSPPLFFLMAWVTAKLGDPTVWIRLPSIILGSATVPMVFLIGRETVGERAGLIAGAVIALSPFSFYYGVEARPYASMAFFVALSTWALLRAVDGRGARWWVFYALADAAAAYCHYTCIFVLLVQGVWSLWVCRDRIAAPLIAAAGAAVLYAPWIPKLRGKELYVIAFLQPLTAHNVIRDVMRPIAGYPYAPLRAIPTYLGLGLIFACALAGAVFVSVRARRDRDQTRSLGLLIALALASPIGLLLYSKFDTDLWLARGLYASVPAAALVLGALLVAIPRPGNAVAVVVVLGVLAVGAVRAGSASWRRPPSREVAAYLDRRASPRDPVSLNSYFGGGAILVQLQRRHMFSSASRLWSRTPRGAEAFVVLDSADARALKRSVLSRPPAGFRLVSARRFSSAILPLEVSAYRRTG
ncbi:MAG: glycosyltransferase family 39 protein [Solirubrobacteraceae bacterium]